MATVERDVRIEIGSSDDLDSVMNIMDSAFGQRFGEAWTRSQLAGILPMGGVSLILATEPSSGEAVGFSLFRTVADESELLLLAVLPIRHRRGVGRRLLEDFLDRARKDKVVRVHLKFGTAILRSACTWMLDFRRLAGVATIIMLLTASASTQLRWLINFS
jgi:ribosomal-protein-alanine N-acetyltransferase